MIPVGDVIPRRTRPTITAAAVVLLAAALLFFQFALTPATRINWLQILGAHRDTWPWPSIVTACWVEPLWLTGAANLAALALYGPALEDRLGPPRTLTLMALAAASSTTAAALLATAAAPAAGASGIAAAIVAAHLSLFPTSKLVFWAPGPQGGRFWEVPAIWGLAAWTVVVIGELGKTIEPETRVAIPLWSSAAGLAFGAILGRLLARRDRLAIEWWEGAPDR